MGITPLSAARPHGAIVRGTSHPCRTGARPTGRTWSLQQTAIAGCCCNYGQHLQSGRGSGSVLTQTVFWGGNLPILLTSCLLQSSTYTCCSRDIYVTDRGERKRQQAQRPTKRRPVAGLSPGDTQNPTGKLASPPALRARPRTRHPGQPPSHPWAPVSHDDGSRKCSKMQCK